MTRYIALAALLAASVTAAAQTTVQMSVDTDRRYTISPYIYGSNGQSDDRGEGVTARRIGGNRLTGYNWEHNASNAGDDWHHSSDNYLPWIAGIPDDSAQVPGIVLTAFHDTSLAMGAYSLVTLPMAGFVAKDRNGTVSPGETAPSPRWVPVVNRKNAPLSTTPDTTDNAVYTDELLHLLISRYGTAESSTGIRGYALDNEPALWTHTHPRIVPGAVRVDTLLARSANLARTIRDMDPQAEVFGPALYGFSAYRTLQDAPDWNNYTSYRWFIDVYLDSMRARSEQAGTRLLDVLDVHWYPEPAGVYAGDTSRAAANRRMQAPRSLWDSSYVEESWIGQWFSPVAILHQLHHAIDTYYPGTRLAVTEYDYSAPDHVSGGLAQADALGIFGRTDVYFASHWGALDGYIAAGYRLFRNYDGTGGAFGSTGVHAATGNDELTSIYAAVGNGDTLHIILLNKSYDHTVNAVVTIGGKGLYAAPAVWGFDAAQPAITARPFTGTLDEHTLTMALAPLSACHLVLPPAPGSIVGKPVLYTTPLPTVVDNGETWLVHRTHAALPAMVTLADLTGRMVYSAAMAAGQTSLLVPRSGRAAGAYILTVHSGGTTGSRLVVAAP